MLLVIVIVNRMGEGWQEKNGLLTCPYWGGEKEKRNKKTKLN